MLSLCIFGFVGVGLNSCNNFNAENFNRGRNGGKLLAKHPTIEARQKQVAQEQTGNFYYGRRYFVNNTTFWGYLKKPRQPWKKSMLVIMNERDKYKPDQLPEDGPTGARKGYDQNYNYRIWGHYTGKKMYDPNSNQFLPEFRLKRYQLLDKNPGWLFSPKDRYTPNNITLPNQHNRL